MTTVLVLGASRGIGLEFVRQYRENWDRVIATARDTPGRARLEALGARAIQVDVTDPMTLARLAWELDGEKIDIALHVAGVYSTAGATQPPTREEFDQVMHTNVLGAMQTLTQVAPLVEAARGKLAFISSQMGHIAGVGSSFGWTYRVSKAALNMAVAAAQHDYPAATLVALSPGWVQTDMGGPNAPLTVEQSVSAMRATVARLNRRHRGAFLNYDGRRFKGW